jgi:menaquinone-dependent protoporphyrinogen oxidase
MGTGQRRIAGGIRASHRKDTMNILIAYATQLGSTKEIAERIALRLQGHGLHTITSTVELAPDVSAFDGAVVGSAVYAGHWLDAARQFIATESDQLSRRPVWLFSSGPVGDLAVGADPRPVPELRGLMTRIAAKGHRIFAGALDRGTVDAGTFPVLIRLIAKRFVPEGDWRNWQEIDAWADVIAGELSASQLVPSPGMDALAQGG